ncbi:MAG: ABC transporter permease subunit, partial [Geminicoccaceae bacterium]
MIEFLAGYGDYIWDWLPEFAIASLQTLQLMVISFCLACVLGMIVALLRISRFSVLRTIAKIYIGFFRGVPVLVILY